MIKYRTPPSKLCECGSRLLWRVDDALEWRLFCPNHRYVKSGKSKRKPSLPVREPIESDDVDCVQEALEKIAKQASGKY